ncbi:MAG: rod shape-determining protein MreC [Patescibacteria group bacterium]
MNIFLKRIIIVLVIIALIVATHYLGWLKPAENLLVKSLSFFQEKTHAASRSLKSFKEGWLIKRDLLKENGDLKDQLKNYQLDQSKLKSLAEENLLLKKELKFTESSGYKFISAKIITGVSDPLSQSVVINRGKKDGVVAGLAVVAEQGILVGKVFEAEDGYAKVTLLTDNKSKVAATVQNLTQTIGLVEGQFGLGLQMTNIPQNEDVKEGDLIVTSGLEGQIPKNLLIARVENVRQVKSEIFKTAILSLIISLNNLSDVLVIIP